MRPGEDIGLDRGGQTGRQRAINPDGSYNMERKTGRLMGNFYLYNWLINTSWTKFWIAAVVYYTVMNFIFAMIYYVIGTESLGGMPPGTEWDKFLYCFFFSTESFTTVGFGGIHPISKFASGVAAIEAFTGLMTFALATGTLYGRFSRPFSKIKYSSNILIAPFQKGTGMQFMVVNEMSASMMEVEARVNISWLEQEGKKKVRKYQQVKLEIDKIAMFPTSWVINHPIDEDSILYGKSLEQIKEMEVEVFVLLKGFDETFSQMIYSRQSYTEHQFIYGAKFQRPFEVNEKGKIALDLTKVGVYDLVSIE